MPGRFALDIETISPTLGHYERPDDFDDPTNFELFSVALGYERPDGGRETAHLVRESATPAAELALVERVVDWLTAREADAFVTYNGSFFDLPILRERARIAGAAADRPGVAESLAGVLADLGHVDPKEDAWAAFGDYTRLDEALDAVGLSPAPTPWAEYDHGIDLDAERPAKYRGIPKVINTDVPFLGERYLALADAGATDTLTFRELAAMLDHYALEDVVHLFDLADARPF